MKEYGKKKYGILIIVVMLVISIIGINRISNIDINKGKIKVVNANITQMSTKLMGNVNEITQESNVQTKGYDEVSYKVKYTLTSEEKVEKRNVIIKATLDPNEKYAEFKEVENSTLREDKKEIEIKEENVEVGKEQEIEIKMLVKGAPSGYKITPKVQIKEETGEYNTVTVNEVEVKTNSITGYVTDEEGMPVSNIIVALKKKGEIIKETYTKEDGTYTFSDIEIGTYEIEIDEEVYEKVKEENVSIEGNNRLDIVVKQVEPYKIETHKYITELKIKNLGKETVYTYGEISRVQQAIKNLKEIQGEVYYKITVENTGEKEGIITTVKDEIPEGLSFNKEKNAGWEEEDGKVYNRSLEGVSLKGNEKREEILILDIENTSEARNYINKVTIKGEVYEKVKYILDGEEYKEEEVLEGEKIKEEIIEEEGFSGWYTDKKYTNKYNFDNEVTKDLILYGKTKERHTVKFKDKDPETKEEIPWDEQEVPDGEPAKEPERPEHEGYEFKCWEDENGVEWDFKTPVTKDLTLTTCYNKKEYTVEFYNYENKKEKELKVKYKETINTDEVPELKEEGYTFIGWYEIESAVTFDFTTKITRNIKLYPKHKIIENAVIFNDENRITTKEVEYGSTVEAIESLGKEGYTFKHWSLNKNGEAFDFNTKIVQTTTLYAVYEINKYTVNFKDKDPETKEEVPWGEPQVIPHGEPANEPERPEHEGYEFECWEDEEGNIWDFDTPVTKDLTLTTCYSKKEYTVKFINEGNVYNTQKVKYKEKATRPKEDPKKEHNIFINWVLENQEEYNFENLVTQDITLYSKYEEVETPIIEHTPTTWTNSAVNVTVRSNHEDYTYQYKTLEEGYKEYSNGFKVEENTTVSAYSVKSGVSSVASTHEIDNIDKINPEIKGLKETTVGKTEFTIEIKTQDLESGMKSISIYKDEVYETSIEYTNRCNNKNDQEEVCNEERTSTYTFNGLEAGETYTVKIIAYDVAGNSIESEELEVTTTEEERIVARIIGRNGSLYGSEEQYENFPTLEAAVRSCGASAETCTIQMVDNTQETVDINSDQNITLDINGKTISGARDYTLQNSGKLTIVDNAEEAGSIVNRNESSVALKNIEEGILTIGENDEEFNVSVEKPYIYGSSLAVQKSSGTFNFYDGKLEGKEAISGSVDDTPYSYNASVSTNENNQVATLRKISDPEARIGSVYYTKLAAAVGDTANGTAQEITEEKELLKGFKTKGMYGFDYNEETGQLESNNNIIGTTARAYTTIDLTNSENEQSFTINYLINGSGKESIIVKEESSDGTIINSNAKSTSTINYILSAGKRYYLEISFVAQKSITTTNRETDSKMIIYSISLQSRVLKGLGLEDTDEIAIKNYGFEYDEKTNTLRSTDQYVGRSKAFSYIEVDLTNEKEDKDLLINAYVDTYLEAQNDYSYILVYDELTIPTEYYYNDYLAYIYPSYYAKGFGRIGTYNYTKTLKAGEKYYVEFYRYKNISSYPDEVTFKANNCTDQFVITQFDVVSSMKSENVDLSTQIIKSDTATYGFKLDASGAYLEPENQSNLASYNNTTAHSYIKVDMTDEKEDKIIKVMANSGTTDFYSVVTNSKELPNNENAFMDANQRGLSSNYNGYYYETLTKGKVNYVHFVYNRSTTSNNIQISNIDIIDAKSIDLSNLRNITGEKYVKGQYSYEAGYGVPLINSESVNDSYIEIDLTNENKNQYLRINAQLNYNNIKYIYLTNNKKGLLSSQIDSDRSKSLLYWKYSIDAGDYTVRGEDNKSYYKEYFRNYNYVLTKGNKYYLHFVTEWNPDNTNQYDTLRINSIFISPISEHLINIGDYQVNNGTISKNSIMSDPDKDTSVNILTNDATEDGNFRYIGKNPSNYISFNDELWRIIGIFNVEGEDGEKKKRIKIIKNDSIGGYVYDTTPYNSSGQAVNAGNGINSWNQADLMKLLNPEYDNNEEELFIRTGNSSSYVYTSSGINKVNNSLYWKMQSGNCFSGQYNTYTMCDFTQSGIKDKYKDYIDTVVWNLGALPYDTTNLTPNQMYVYERGNATGKTNFENTNNFPEDNVERRKAWIGKIALPYASDYIMASGSLGSGSNIQLTRTSCMTSSTNYGGCSNANNWMVTTQPLTLLSPLYGQQSSTSMSYPFSVATAATMLVTSIPAAATTYGTKPALYLSTKTKIIDGTGSSTNPYKIELGDKDNTAQYYGLVETEDDEDEKENIIIPDEETDDYKLLKGRPVYTFNYDAETQTFNNPENMEIGSLAVLNVKVDATTLSQSKLLSVDVSSRGSGYIYLDYFLNDSVPLDYSLGGYVNQDTSLIYTSGNYSNNLTIEVKPGNVGHIQFALYVTSSNPKASIKMNSLQYLEPENNFMYYERNSILNEDADEVQLLKNIVLNDALNVESTRNVIIDLNGYTLTSTSDDLTAVKNNGNLQINDNKFALNNDNTGYINRIINNYGGALNIESGDIQDIQNYGTVNSQQNSLIQSLSSLEAGDILNGNGTIDSLNLLADDNEFSGYIVNDNITVGAVVNISNINQNMPNTPALTILDTGALNIRDTNINTIQNDGYLESYNININGNITNHNKMIINGSQINTNISYDNYDAQTTLNSLTVNRSLNLTSGELNLNNSTINGSITQTKESSSYRYYQFKFNSTGSTITGNVSLYCESEVDVNFDTSSVSDFNNYGCSVHSTGSTFKNFSNLDYRTSYSSRGHIYYYYYANGDVVFDNLTLLDGQIVNTNNMTINSGTIKSNDLSNKYAITNKNGSYYSETQSTPSLTITGDFNIENYDKGIQNNYRTILTLGENNDDVNTDIKINTKSIGISSEGGEENIFNYYDGSIVGNKDNALVSHINSIPNGYEIKSTIDDDNKETITLERIDDENRDYIVSIDGVNYKTLSNAIENVPDNNIETQIKVIKDFTTAYSTEIPETKNVKIDYNNHSIKSYNSDSLILNNGILSIVDESTDKNAISESYSNKLYDNHGVLNYNDVINESMINNAKIIDNSGNATINSGTMQGKISHPIINNQDSTLTINNGTLKGLDNYGTTNIHGGDYTGNNVFSNYGNLIVDGGNYNSSNKESLLINSSNSSAVISDVNTGSAEISNYQGNVTLNNCTVDGNVNNYYEGANLEINKGTFSKQISSYGGTIVIDDIDLQTDSSPAIRLDAVDAYLYYGYTNDLIIKKGNVVSKSGNAIDCRDYVCNIIIGEKGNTDEDGNLLVSKESPNITGKNYGIYSTNTADTIKFYDGIITGKTAVSNKINELEDNYELITIKNETNESIYLDQLALLENKTKNIKYRTFKQALSEATEGDTLELLRDYKNISTDETITNDKDITIDLAGHEIIQNNSVLISNSGDLKIVSNISGAKITTKEEGIDNVFINNGTLTISENITVTSKKGNIITNNESATFNLDYTKMVIPDSGNGLSCENHPVSIINKGTSKINHANIESKIGCQLIENVGDLTIENSAINQSYSIRYYHDRSQIITEGYSRTGYSKDLINTTSKLTLKNTDIDRVGSLFDDYDYMYHSLINNTGEVSIDGGTFTADEDIFMTTTGTATVSNVEVTTNNHGVMYSGVATINDSNITAKRSVFSQSDDATLTINDGTYSSEGLVTEKKWVTSGAYHDYYKYEDEYYGVVGERKYSYKSSNININGGTYTNKKYSVLTDNSISDKTKINSLTITKGTISTNSEYAAIYGYDNIVIGIKEDENVSTTDPSISSNGNTIEGSNNGDTNIYFYDGILKSKSAYKTIGDENVHVVEIEPEYTIVGDSNSNYLEKSNVVKNLTKQKEYFSIQEAINDGDYNDNLQMLISTISVGVVKVPVNKKFNLDLNGNTVIGTYENNGEFEITNNNDKNGYMTIVNNTGTNLTISGGTYKKVTSTNNSKTTINSTQINNIVNEGSFVIQDSNINEFLNNGTVDFNGGSISKVTNDNTFNMNSGSIDTLDNNLKFDILNGNVTGELTNRGDITINNGIFNNITNYKNLNIYGDITVNKILSNNQNTNTIIRNSTITSNNIIESGFETQVTVESSTIPGIKGSKIKLTDSIVNGNIMPYSGYTNLEAEITGGTINGNVAASNSTFTNVTVNGKLDVSGKTSFISGKIVSSTYGLTNTGDLIIGELGSVVSKDSPSIKGTPYGVINNGNMYFYDGIIIGTEEAISGKVNEVEPGYKIVINNNEDSSTKSATLDLIGDDDARVAVVNKVNFDNLQAAINYAASNAYDVVLYADITLESDLTIAEGLTVNVYLNGHTITNGDYTIAEGIHLEEGQPTGLTGSIVNAIKDVLNIDDISRNVIIYEMEDGSKLSSEKTYKLYKKDDNEYQLMKMKREEEIGRYIIGNNIEEMRTVRGRIYINELSSGEYKIEDNEGKEIVFTITKEGKVSTNVIDNTQEKEKSVKISQAIAELIITIQTGITRGHLMILFILILLLIILLYFVNKRRKLNN